MLILLQIMFATFVGTVCVLGFSKWLVEIFELDKQTPEPEPVVRQIRLMPKGTHELVKVHQLCINRFVLGIKTPTQKIKRKRLMLRRI